MKLKRILTWVACCVCCIHAANAQQTAVSPFQLDSSLTFHFEPVSLSYRPSLYSFSISHDAQQEQLQTIAKFGYLKTALPDTGNYQQYALLAEALWENGDTADARRMFRTILYSKAPFYNRTARYASDVPGDTAPLNSYGYGSFSVHPKHDACLYLAKSEIEQGAYRRAMDLLDSSRTVYRASFSCGTGHQFQTRQYDELFGACYLGLNWYDTILRKYLPDVLDRRDDIIVRALKARYSLPGMQRELDKAVASIVLKRDKYPSEAVYSADSSGAERKMRFYRMQGYVIFMKKKLEIASSFSVPPPESHEDFEHVFKESAFYRALTDPEGYR